MQINQWDLVAVTVNSEFFDFSIFIKMRDLISGRAFKAKKKMDEAFVRSQILRGGSALVEQTIRDNGWNPLDPVATVTVYVNDKNGKVNATKLVLAGTMPGFEIPDISAIFPKAPKSASIQFGNLDLNGLRFMTSEMSTRWIPDSEFSWNLMVDGLDESGQDERIPVTPANLHQYNVNNIALRVSAQPTSADKMKLSIGIAPVSHDTIKKTPQFDDLGFPVIEVCTFVVNVHPQDDIYGIGFLPYILDKRKEDDANPLPTSAEIKSAACDLLARAIMPTAKKSTKTWQETIAKGDWSARESSKEWPQPLDSEDDGESEEDVSGRFKRHKLAQEIQKF